MIRIEDQKLVFYKSMYKAKERFLNKAKETKVEFIGRLIGVCRDFVM